MSNNDSPLTKDLSLEEIEKRLIDCKDTRDHLIKTKWNSALNISKEDFEKNTQFSLGMVDNFERELLKNKLEKEKG